MDLDGFKDVNDLHGHHMGDTVLRLVAQRLAHVVRAGDTLARLGRRVHHPDAWQTQPAGTPSSSLDRLLQIFDTPFALPDTDGVQVTLGVSIGVAAHPPLPAQVDELLTRADHAMYEARCGKGTCTTQCLPRPECPAPRKRHHARRRRGFTTGTMLCS